MRKLFEMNQIRLILHKKAGRRITEKVICCLWCPSTYECEHKKIRVPNVNWKQWVPLRQYCNTVNCGKKTINFRSVLAKKLLNPTDRTAFLTAQYCLWKMLARTPIKYLNPILVNNFEHARPKQNLVEVLEAIVN